MEKSKHEYEVEIQTLKQHIMNLEGECAEVHQMFNYDEEVIETLKKRLKHSYKLIEILLDKLEREER